MSAAGRKRIKEALAARAQSAVSDVFNDLFPLAAEDAPHGSIRHYARWHVQAFRRALERYERTADLE